MRFNVSFGVKASLLTAVLVVTATLGSVIAYSKNAVYEDSVAPSTPVSTTAKTTSLSPAKSTTAGGNAQPTTVVAIRQTAPVQSCVTGALMPIPAAPAVSPNQPGLHEAALTTTSYQIFGNTLDQVRAQAFSCSPVMQNGERFSGYTGYSISWVFDLKSDGNNVCTVNNVSVGLSIAQQYPSWQANSSAARGLSATWQTYLNNLTTHEMGHANLDRSYAASLLDQLRAFPATDCSTISNAVTAKAQGIIGALDAANEAYDHSTGHGTSQGAVL